jgi:hypothetical protein
MCGKDENVPAVARPTRSLWVWLLPLLILGLGTLGSLVGVGLLLPDRRGPQAPTEIFQGITYGREQLEETLEGRGHLDWVRIDLAASGIQLYATPLDSGALARGWQYRLRRISDVVDEEHLAVAINGTLFTSNSFAGFRMAGDLANSVETVVADHVVSHVWEHTYLLWFDDQLTPHLDYWKPPKPADLARAKWGIGGQGVGLQAGRVGAENDRRPDARTAVGIDQQRKLLFLAVGENISPRLILQKLAAFGAMDGMLLDGGSSSAMAIGRGAVGIEEGVLHGGWRPVATFFGVKAKLRK